MVLFRWERKARSRVQAGQADIELLLIIKAMACVNWAGGKTASAGIMALADAREEAAYAGGDRTDVKRSDTTCTIDGNHRRQRARR